MGFLYAKILHCECCVLNFTLSMKAFNRLGEIRLEAE